MIGAQGSPLKPTLHLRWVQPVENDMTRHPIVVTGILPPVVAQALAAAYAARQVDLQRDGQAALLDALEDARAIVVIPGDPIGEDLIRALPGHVGLIASYSTGLDHIDVAAAQARGIRVTNTPDVLTDATADTAILLLLATLRGAAAAASLIQEKRWTGWQPGQIFGWDLKGRTLGIFGGGRIGVATARRARAFGMALVYHSRRASEGLDTLGARFIPDVDDFWGAADVISLHVPLSPGTRHLVNSDAIARMRRGSFLINTARGDLVDDLAVIAALKSGKLAGVGLDVFSGEPHVNPGYLGLPQAFLLPHIGSATHETREMMGKEVLKSLAAFFGVPSIVMPPGTSSANSSVHLPNTQR